MRRNLVLAAVAAGLVATAGAPDAGAADEEDVRKLKETGDCQGCDLHAARLDRIDLGKADLRGADLGRADLRNTGLQDADLRKADLRDAYMTGANLKGADLRDADLRDADMVEAAYQGADLSGAQMRGAQVTRQAVCGPAYRPDGQATECSGRSAICGREFSVKECRQELPE